MLTDETATPEQIQRHLERLRRLLQRANCAEDWETARWVVAAIDRCERQIGSI